MSPTLGVAWLQMSYRRDSSQRNPQPRSRENYPRIDSGELPDLLESIEVCPNQTSVGKDPEPRWSSDLVVKLCTRKCFEFPNGLAGSRRNQLPQREILPLNWED